MDEPRTDGVMKAVYRKELIELLNLRGKYLTFLTRGLPTTESGESVLC